MNVFIRITFTVLAVALAAICGHAFAVHETQFAIKLLFPTAIFSMIAVRPERVFLLNGGPGVLRLRRNYLAFWSVFLFAVDVFGITMIQIPHEEEFAHFTGQIVTPNVCGEAGQSAAAPCVRFVGANGQSRVFLDKFAGALFPGRKFNPGEKVSVAVSLAGVTFIDQPLLIRWDLIIFLTALIAFCIAAVVMLQAKIASSAPS